MTWLGGEPCEISYESSWLQNMAYIDKVAKPKHVFFFNSRPDWNIYHIYREPTGQLNMQFIHCTCSGEKCDVLFDENVTIQEAFIPALGELAQHQADTLYLFLFRWLFPFMFLTTSVFAALFLFIKLQRLRRLHATIPLFRAVINHKGGRTSVMLILLFMESIACGLLSVINHLVCNFCTDSSVREAWANASLPMLTFTSMATTLLAGTFWYDRRRALERRANFVQSTDERPFFVRKRKLIRTLAGFGFILDGAVAYMLYDYIQYVELIVGGIMTFFCFAVAIVFLREALIFYSMVNAIIENSNGAFSRESPGLKNMLSISRWFVLSSLFILIFGINSLTLVISGDNFFSLGVWTPFWTIGTTSRIMMSFCQVMLCKPEHMCGSVKVAMSSASLGDNNNNHTNLDDASESSLGTTQDKYTVQSEE